MGDLAQGMYPGIGASGGGDGVVARFQTCQRSLDRALDRGLIGLTLPPGEGGANIFDPESIARHGRAGSLPRGSGQGA